MASRPTLSDPVLVVETLSPSNEAKTWTNVWAYTSIPSAQEILILRSERTTAITGSDLELASISFRVALADLYARTSLTG